LPRGGPLVTGSPVNPGRSGFGRRVRTTPMRDTRGRENAMTRHLFLNRRWVSWRALLLSLGTSAMLVSGALNPAPLAAAPARADLKEVARQDTLMVSGFGAGLTEIQDPTNMNPYSLGGLGRV